VPERDHDKLARKRELPQARVRVWPRIGGRRWVGGTVRKGAPPQIVRAVLIVLSLGGVSVCLWLWSSGHAYLALRVLAGDVILATVLLLVV
jgi:hypothetical protein